MHILIITASLLYQNQLHITVTSVQNNANKIEWGNDISFMKCLGNICSTVICHLDTSTCTKLRYYIKLLVRSCFTWGNMTDLGLYNEGGPVPKWQKCGYELVCACRYTHKRTHTRGCPSTNLDSVKTFLLSHADKSPNDSGGENERKSLERFRRLSKVKTSRHVRHFSNSALFLDLMSSCSASHSTLLF